MRPPSGCNGEGKRECDHPVVAMGRIKGSGGHPVDAMGRVKGNALPSGRNGSVKGNAATQWPHKRSR